MKNPPTRLLLLVMGFISTALFGVGYATGGKPDDALLVFAGSMFTTYALTERRGTNDENDPPMGPM